MSNYVLIFHTRIFSVTHDEVKNCEIVLPTLLQSRPVRLQTGRSNKLNALRGYYKVLFRLLITAAVFPVGFKRYTEDPCLGPLMGVRTLKS